MFKRPQNLLSQLICIHEGTTIQHPVRNFLPVIDNKKNN